ncbi:Retrovirus-related Pol polyprotein from transposon 17.6 [Porphyridium purpureum]|uniref:RNA-directed DNA polymerase n=1 Tax=Porphyridium purpureum TaxID=35688 RepID=A0A5J4YJI8_PORPP|nr:Retrovirus-related Pol polyprotein from transposon 17.6 [Porphyridium purpureum]|eukprot:POR2650..scf246_12
MNVDVIQSTEAAMKIHDESITVPVMISTSSGEVRVLAKIDTGAGHTFVDHVLFDQLEGEETLVKTQILAFAADGRALGAGETGKLMVRLPGWQLQEVPVQVLPRLRSGVLLGRDFLRAHGARIDFVSSAVSFDQVAGGKTVIPFGHSEASWRDLGPDGVMPHVLDTLAQCTVNDEQQAVLTIISNVDLQGFREHAEEVRECLRANAEVFCGAGAIEGEEYCIILKPGAVPVTKHLRSGTLVPCEKSEWESVHVFVRKRSGQLRMTTDFRLLNAQVAGEVYPLQDLHEVLEKLARRSFYSSLDLKDGFFNIRLAAESQPLTAVKTCIGLVMYTRLPQGLKTSPFAMQRAAANLTRPFGDDAVAYMDDITLATDGVEEHVALLKRVVERFRRVGARLNTRKCTFGVPEVTVLGHAVSAGTIRPSDEHVQSIRDLQEPRDAAALVRFLGLVNWFSQHIPRFAEMVQPLYDVLKGTGWNRKKRGRWERIIIKDFTDRWGTQQQQAWSQLKEQLSSPEVLVAPVQGRVKRLFTDASAGAIAGVLMQDEGNEVEKELLAILYAGRKLRHHLHGEPVEFVTDHQALAWLWRQQSPIGRLARWLLALQDLEYTIRYQPGADMAAPNCLSRDTVLAEDDEWRDLPDAEHVDDVVTYIGEVIEVQSGLPSLMELLEAQKAALDYELADWEQDDTFARNEKGLIVCVDKDEERAWVPSAMVRRVLSYFHGPTWAGHFGRERMLRRIRTKFWWPQMAETIHAFLEQ